MTTTMSRLGAIFLGAFLAAIALGTTTLASTPSHPAPNADATPWSARVALHTYYAFGREITDTNQDAEPLKYTGHERDSPDLDYMHARYYLPGWGRFLSVDPVLDTQASRINPQRWNRYSYVSNNPISKIDPDGRDEYAMSERLLGLKPDWERDKRQLRMLASLGVSATPQVGDGYDVVVAASGRDHIAGENVSGVARWGGVLLPFARESSRRLVSSPHSSD